ncbi:hypothetical protein H072_2102 [Dactylellina haptotyla CBS 200.50]|uniref:Uncharacterized protein n=1 Tax=Dactylellina haptotyla (strain CBS 200.50) TaxID=1284197 RepID=S8AM21_DACHA|nr:hypothetical protein H072_2102 [Dactylellina haptotyla CBS 200.50]
MQANVEDALSKHGNGDTSSTPINPPPFALSTSQPPPSTLPSISSAIPPPLASLEPSFHSRSLRSSLLARPSYPTAFFALLARAHANRRFHHRHPLWNPGVAATMAYSAHKSAIPPPSPSPYSRLPTPASSRPHASRSASTSVYGSSHRSPSRPAMPHHASSYDSFAPQPCPSPSPSKIPGFGLHRPGSTLQSPHKRQVSVAEKAKVFERPDDAMMRSVSTSRGLGYNGSRGTVGSRRESFTSSDAASSAALRTPSRPGSYVDNGVDREPFNDVKSQLSSLRRPSQSLSIPSGGLGKQEYGNQASPAPMRKSLGLLGEQSPALQQTKDVSRMDDSQLMPPPPPSLLRQLSSTSTTMTPPVTLESPMSAPQKPPTPPPQVPTPSPRKGTHIRAQSHVIASKPPPRTNSTRPVDPRPTSTAGRKVTGPVRPASTLHDVPSARPRAVSHNAVSHNAIEPRRMATPANDLSLPKGARQTVGRAIAPPRSTSTRPTEPVATSSASTRRSTITNNRIRPTSSHMPPPPVPISSSRGSDTESSLRSESVASTTSNTSSARSDVTTRPKTAVKPTTASRSPQEPSSPRKTSPIRGHRKVTSTMAAAKPSKPSFNSYKVDYPPVAPVPKPTSASIIHQSSGSAAPSHPTDVAHAQTKLLQLAILHARSFDSTTALTDSARNALYKRFSIIRDKNAAVAESYHREQELVDLHALSLIMKRSPASNFTSLKDKLSSSPEESIQLLSEQLSKVLGWFAEGQYEGEYIRMIRIFEEWASLPEDNEKKIDGLGADYTRDILRVKRKMEMAVRSLEGWMGLVVDGEKDEDGEERGGLTSSLRRLLTVAVGRLRAALEELTVIQNIEKLVVTTIRKELRKKLGEVMDTRKEVDLSQQKKDLAAWQPVWATSS